MSQIRSLNRVILVGRVGRNPEITVIANTGRELAKISMVTNEGYYDQNRNWKEMDEWHNIVAWGPTAQRVEKTVGKGDLILVEGKLKSRKWKDQSGQDRKIVEIEAQNIIVLDRRNRNEAGVGTPNNSRPDKIDSKEFESASMNYPSSSIQDPQHEDFGNEEDPF